MADQERLQHKSEYEKNTHEELERIGAERRGELHEKLKETKESSPENLEKAHREALEHARTHEKESVHHEQESPSPEKQQRVPSNNKARAESFNTTMREVQSQMSAPSRLFSKVIHNKVVEKTSEVMGSTIARPNALLSGAIFAFLFTLAVYLVAKNFGYPLSGFETIVAFAAGWLAGIVYDFLKIMVTGRK